MVLIVNYAEILRCYPLLCYRPPAYLPCCSPTSGLYNDAGSLVRVPSSFEQAPSLAEPSDDAQIKSGTGVRLPCNTQCYDTEKWQHPHIIAVNLIPNQERVCNT